jgi:hypothetical protein
VKIRRWLRRHGPMLLVAAAALWIITVIIWITVHPVESPGDPMY